MTDLLASAETPRAFPLALRLFDRTTRERALVLYHWLQRCDALAGTPDDHRPARERLAQIEQLMHTALAGQSTGDAAFDNFGMMASAAGIPATLAQDVIAGFALDAADWSPRSQRDLLQYCYHVAGAPGTMMAMAMGISDSETLDAACDLGIALELTDIARDMADDDADERCYIPDEWLAEADIPPGEQMKPLYRAQLLPLVKRLVDLQQAYEAAGRGGASRMTFRQRWGVLAAAGIYGDIAMQVEQAGSLAWHERIRSSFMMRTRHVLIALWEAITPPPRSAAPPPLTRSELAARAGQR